MSRRYVGELVWRDYCLRVAVPDRRWFDWLSQFTGLAGRPTADFSDPLITLEVVDALHVLVDGSDLRRFATPNDLKAWLFLTVSDVMIDRGGLTVLHAAGFVVHGKAVLAAGPPFAGKSSWALGARQLGLMVLGDDQVSIDRYSGQVCAVPRPLKRRLRSPADRRRLSANAFSARIESEDIALEPLRYRAGPNPEEMYPVAMVVHLSRHSGPGVECTSLDDFTSKCYLLEQIRCFARDFRSAVGATARVLGRLPNYRLSIGDDRTLQALDVVLTRLSEDAGEA